MPALRLAPGLDRLRSACGTEHGTRRRNAEPLAMFPIRSRSATEGFEIRARCECRSCGKARELGTVELYGAADIKSLKELERRFRCSDFRKKEISIEPIWHKDWVGA
jgi:hypothetical protein